MTKETENGLPWWAMALVVLACLAGIVDRDLWTPDEPRDAAVALDMARTGNYVVPVLAGEPFIEKPPLYFAVAGLAERVLGGVLGPVGAIRLTTALWGLGVLGATFLLARRMGSRELAWLAVLLLGTMIGFVENMHWIRVDAALAFFVMASVWCFGEVFIGGRGWFCLPAGLFCAGAFLSKGAVGPVFIAIGWAALAGPVCLAQWRESRRMNLFIVPHLAALAAFVLVSGVWVLLLRKVGGEELWNEWFWENHVGRMKGTTTQLGHLYPGMWWYYLQTVAVYTLPWIPLLLIGLWRFAVAAWKRPSGAALKGFLLSPGLFAVLWGVGSIVVLSQSVTKRDIYLLPALPAFALLCAEGARDPLPRWAAIFYRFWLWLCAVVLLAVAMTPLILRFVPEPLREQAPALLASWSLRHLAAMLACAGAFLLARATRPSLAVRLAASMALVFIAAFSVPGKAVDSEKSMGAAYQAFAEQIPVELRPRIAAWNFSETTRGGLAFYGGLALTRITDPARLDRILAGRDDEFDSVVMDWDKDLSEVVRRPHRIRAEGRPGAVNRKRPLYWVQGIKEEQKP